MSTVKTFESARISRPEPRRGMILADVIMATGMVLGMLAVFAVAMTQYVNHTETLLTRQRAAMAAEAVLTEIRLGHEPTAEEFAARFSGLAATIERAPGTDAWAGLTRVDVEVQSVIEGRTPVSVRLSSFVREVKP